MPELIAKTPDAVAVTDELTVILDWVNIELVSGFTIIIANAGGGSANDITDVQIDTSDDGGLTANEDQHAGVPAVPIASGSSKVGTFTETAKFVRIRAICASEEDTTASAILLADSAVGRICTLADVRDRLGITETEHDQMLNRIILGIEELFGNYTRRNIIITAADVTEYYTGAGCYFKLDRYPICSVTSLIESWDYDFGNTDPLVKDTDFRWVRNGKNGILYRINTSWLTIVDSIEVVYRGGYCSAGQTPGDGETAMPADLREAAIEQASFIFKRKDDIGLTGVGFEGGSISKFSAMDLLPMVKKTLDNYRRTSL